MSNNACAARTYFLTGELTDDALDVTLAAFVLASPGAPANCIFESLKSTQSSVVSCGKFHSQWDVEEEEEPLSPKQRSLKV